MQGTGESANKITGKRQGMHAGEGGGRGQTGYKRRSESWGKRYCIVVGTDEK